MKIILLSSLLFLLACNKDAKDIVDGINAPSSITSTIEADGGVEANGTDNATVTITLRNSINLPIVGVTPTFSATDFESTNTYGACSASDANGVSKCTLSSLEGETKILSIVSPISKVGGSVVFTEVDRCTGNELLAPFAVGNGTLANPYGICTTAQFASIGANPAYLDKHFKLYKNLNFSSYTGTSAPVIGSLTLGFSGTFNGNRKTITGFTYTNLADTQNNQGLFRTVAETGVIKNLNLTNVSVTAKPKVATGGLVGSLLGTIQNCTVQGTIDGYSQVGGVAGSSAATAKINDSSFDGSVTGGANMIGGLTGRLNGGEITGGFAKGQVKGTFRVGGLVGSTSFLVGSNISSSYFEGNVESTTSGEAGGLVGRMVGNITKSYAKATLICQTWCGGLVGTYGDAYYNTTLGHSSLIDKSYAESMITGVSSIGGLVGYSFANSNIENCYAKTSIISTGDHFAGLAGGLLGNAKNSYALPLSLTVNTLTNWGGLVTPVATGVVTSSFWDKDLDPNIPNTESAALSTLQMKTAKTFIDAGWDPAVWDLKNGSYPALK